MTIGKKLILSVGGMLAVVLGLAYSSLSSITSLGAQLNEAVNSEAKKLDLTGQLLRDLTDMDASQRSAGWRAGVNDPAGVSRFAKAFDRAFAKAENDVKLIQPLLQDEAERQSVDAIQAAMNAWRVGFHEFIKVAAADSDPKSIASFHDEKLAPLMDRSDLATEGLVDIQRGLMKAAENDAVKSSSRARWLVFAFLGLFAAIGGVMLWVIRQISHTLRDVAGELSVGAEQVSSAATQVSSSSQALAQGASEQAASLEETSASSEEITSMARQNVESSRVAAELVTESQKKFVQTNESLDQMVVAMGEINRQSEKIAKVIKVIDEIAFQTNILALNASVEAARAGEAGLGFAVVADEVRNLSQRCAQAAHETSELIEESIAKSNNGRMRVDQVAVAIRTITEESTKVKTLVDEVSQGSREQTTGMEQVAKAIIQMEQVTQSAAASAEQSSAAAEELSSQSESVKGIVARLTAMVGA